MKELEDSPNIEQVFVCRCYTEGLMVRGFDDDEGAYISLWGYKGNGTPLRAKLRYCWNMLRWGYSADEVVLDKKTANKLGEFLSSWKND